MPSNKGHFLNIAGPKLMGFSTNRKKTPYPPATDPTGHLKPRPLHGYASPQSNVEQFHRVFSHPKDLKSRSAKNPKSSPGEIGMDGILFSGPQKRSLSVNQLCQPKIFWYAKWCVMYKSSSHQVIVLGGSVLLDLWRFCCAPKALLLLLELFGPEAGCWRWWRKVSNMTIREFQTKQGTGVILSTCDHNSWAHQAIEKCAKTFTFFHTGFIGMVEDECW